MHGVDTEYVVGEFNCSCVGISKFQAVCGGEKTLADVSDEDYFDACRLTDLMGVKAIQMISREEGPSVDHGFRRPYRFCAGGNWRTGLHA